MPTGTRASRPRRFTARRDTRSGLSLWRFLLSIRCMNPSLERGHLSLLLAATRRPPFDTTADSFTDTGAVRVKLDCRASASAGNGGGIAFIRVSSHINPVSCSVTASGPYPAPGGSGAALLWLRHPAGLGSSQNKFVSAAKNAAQTSSGPRQESAAWPWEPGPLARLRPV